MDAQEMSMSNSSDALVGAAGMKPRKRGLSAEIDRGREHRRVHAENLIRVMPLLAEQSGQRDVQFGRIARARIQRNRIEPQPVLRVGEHGPDHHLGGSVHAVHGGNVTPAPPGASTGFQLSLPN